MPLERMRMHMVSLCFLGAFLFVASSTSRAFFPTR